MGVTERNASKLQQPPSSAALHNRENSDAVAQLSREEVRSPVRACIDRLPDEFRTIVLLHDIEGLNTTEAAQILGVGPLSKRAWIAHATPYARCFGQR